MTSFAKSSLVEISHAGEEVHIDLINHMDYRYKLAIKVSSFGFDEDLIHMLN